MPPQSRCTDPVTSHLAAERHNATGKRATNKAIVLAAVKANPGLTSAEYAHETHLERHEAARRLSDLRNDGLVAQSEPRRCSVQGSRAMTWVLAADDEQKTMW